MELVADASAFLAVVLNEEDREWVIEQTFGSTLVSPDILPYEIGNALIAVRRRGRLTDEEILAAFEMSQRIAVRLLAVRIYDALSIAIQFGIYAYDAFYIQCCLESELPLISLDNRMCEVAENLGIKVVT
jgi:predicted nucleic acid-binding protein